MQVNDKNSGAQVNSNMTAPKSQLQGTSEEFLQLFIAQLKNQDPTDPMDSTDMVTNIAQLNQISYLEDMKNSLRSLAERDNGPSLGDYGSLIDMTVSYNSSRAPEQGGEGAIQGYRPSMTLELIDAQGNRLTGVEVDNNGEFSLGPLPTTQPVYFQVKEGGEVIENTVSLSGGVKEINVLSGEVILDNGHTILYDNIERINSENHE